MNNDNVSYRCNKRMHDLFQLPHKRKNNDRLEKKILKTVSTALCDMKDLGDFLVIQNGNTAEIALGKEEIINKYQDFSGFEHFCNELFFNKLCLDSLADAIFAVLKYLICGLNTFERRNFCLSLSLDLGEYTGTIAMTVHFWQLREGESILDENLYYYNQPVLYARINT